MNVVATRSLMTSRSLLEKQQDLRGRVAGTYYFTSEKGLYRIDPDGIWKVLDVPCYGIALRDHWVFLSVKWPHLRGRSSVIRGERRSLAEPGRSLAFRELYHITTSSSNDRIHGIFLGETGLWVANTGRNTLLRIDPETGQVSAEIPPILDKFGWPVLFDQNHINSVAEYNGTVLFVAYRIGRQSMIGVYDGSRVTGYGYPNVGAHDIFLRADDFLLCDTFGPGLSTHDGRSVRDGIGLDPAPDTGGFLITRNGAFDPDYFERSPGFVLRGLAGSYDELLIGHSHKGPRRKRYKGHGAILVSRHGKVVDKIDVEPSQIYQIITEAGDFVSPAPTSIESSDLHSRFADAFGEPIYQAEVAPLPQGA